MIWVACSRCQNFNHCQRPKADPRPPKPTANPRPARDRGTKPKALAPLAPAPCWAVSFRVLACPYPNRGVCGWNIGAADGHAPHIPSIASVGNCYRLAARRWRGGTTRRLLAATNHQNTGCHNSNDNCVLHKAHCGLYPSSATRLAASALQRMVRRCGLVR